MSEEIRHNVPVTEQDFLDEIYTEVIGVPESQRGELHKKCFKFLARQEDPIIDMYLGYVEKFKRMGVILSAGLVEIYEHVGHTKRIEFHIELVPKKFIDYYMTRYGGNLASGGNAKIDIFVDKDKGIYRIDSPGNKLFYKRVGPSAKIMRMIFLFMDDDIVLVRSITKKLGQEDKTVRQQIERFNNKFKKDLRVNTNPILKSETDGYFFNRDAYKFRWQ